MRVLQKTKQKKTVVKERPSYENVMSSVSTYLGVCSGHLLVQILMAVDGQFQLLHRRGQSSITARLNPTLHTRQKLPNQEETEFMPNNLSLIYIPLSCW